MEKRVDVGPTYAAVAVGLARLERDVADVVKV